MSPTLDKLGLVPADTGWHYFGAAGEPGFQNGWTDYSDKTYGDCRYRRLASNLVIIEGLVTPGTVGAQVFTMPVGYRPQVNRSGARHDLIFVTATSATAVETWRLDSDGALRANASVTAGSWLSLNGVTYYAA